ncbi:hypothetical protein CK556_03755 [Mesoplasma chauliocola]|uniref:Uncharacterized protein n=1 Tax=Mesoplasma chauliocola TaxID=216427 RepID=A0A249SP92_9MOLU|nr:hypothetical protein [Mesoplasma chauliocola]ASZ09440.1 hypothetical protein CK556_03755 [Mesoplasma chauliocola]
MEFSKHSFLAIATSEESQKVSQTAGIIMLTCSALLIVLGVVTILLFRKYLKNKKWKQEQNFKIVSGKYKIMDFWSNYAFIFIIVACFVGSIILFALGIAGTVS